MKIQYRLIIAGVLIGLFIQQTTVRCDPDNGWKQRLEAERAIVSGEVERHHAMMIEMAKIEILARLQQLGATNVSVNNSSYSNSSSRVKAVQKGDMA